MPFFDLSRGDGPVLVEVPHAGLAIPDPVRARVLAPVDAVQRDADIYVDLLYAGAEQRGATLLVSHVSRYVVDLNRAQDDVDAETVPDHPLPRGVQPRGVVWRMTTDGRSVLEHPLSYAELAERLREFHAPYHCALEEELTRIRKEHGFAILLAAHSMPSVGRAGHKDPGNRRADIVPGTRGRTTAHRRVIDLVDAHFRKAGLSVRHDDPYRGGFTTGHYGRPHEGWHAIQIEINRALYVEEPTGKPKPKEFDELAELLMGLVSKLAELRL